MLKIIAPNAWKFHDPIIQMVKVSSRGLLGNDLRSFIKRAGHKFADEFQKVSFAPGEVPIHVIAIGATEAYGPNRNGDGFTEDTCKKYHDTFRKSARWYRNHKNKDKSKGRGIIKLSHYNDEMRRIELLIALNSTKEAADRNKGLVADEEMEKLAKGDDIAVSMACKVPFDVCSGCGNKAQNRNEYCDSSLCKYGGLKSNMGSVLEDGHILHADNPDPQFFDISRVFRPADRIAYTLGRVEKAASAGGIVLSGAELAEECGLTAPVELLLGDNLSATVAAHVKLAYQLVEVEAGLLNSEASGAVAAFSKSVREPIDNTPNVQFVTNTKLAQLTRALAREQIILPVEEFLVVIKGDREKAAAVSEAVVGRMPGIYNRMISDGSLEKTASNNPYLDSAEGTPGEFKSWAHSIAADYAFTKEAIARRLQKSVLRVVQDSVRANRITKLAADDGPAEQLARQYVMYKLASLIQFPSQRGNLELTLALSVMQNHI